MVVPLMLNNVPTLAVIDTGAQITLASKVLCAKAGITYSVDHTIQIRGIGSDMGMPAHVVPQVPITIGNGTYYWTIIVGDFREDFILGLDFLYEVGARLDFHQGFLQIADAIIVAKFLSTHLGHRMAVSPVVVSEKSTIPAMTQQSVVCHVAENLDPGPSMVVEPLGQLLSTQSLSFQPSVFRAVPHVAIPVANLSGQSTNIPVGTIIGVATTAYPVATKASALESEIFSNEIGVDHDTCDLSVDPSLGGADEATAPVMVPDESVGVDGGTSDAFPGADGGTFDALPQHLVPLFLRSIVNLRGEEQGALQQLLASFSDVFASHDFDLGEFTAIMHRIDTGDAAPVRHGLRRTPLGFQSQEEAHLQTMLDHGIIQPSASEWAAAPVIVKKKDGSYRYCVDYRSLNALTKKDSFPLPLIEECLDALADTAFFSTLDMASGYWQIAIDPDDRYKTAFITKYGLFEHVRLAMGLCNSPATYQRIMTYVLQNMLWQNVLVYLDDIIILGSSFNDHLETLSDVFQRFRHHHLKFKPKKCELFCTEVDFLGRRVGREGISIPEAKIRSVTDWPIPVTRTDLESFLGFINYHREFIPQLAQTASVLYQLVKVTPPATQLSWTAEHQQAFEELKNTMIAAPILGYPNATDTFVLDVDASDVAVGAELSQLQGDQECVIAYGSQSLSSAQRKYCTTRKELLALVTFLNHFRFYLLGRNFLVRTDHNSLTWLMRFKNLEGQLARWLEAIAQFDFQIVHRPGRYHGNADGLSRIQTSECPHYATNISVDELPCGGCTYCQRMHQQWDRFDAFVDDVMPLILRAGPAEDDSGYCDFKMTVDWQMEQDNDPDIATVKRWLRDSEEPSDNVLFLQSATVKLLWQMRKQLKQTNDGILLYIWSEPSGVQSRSLHVVPRKLRHEVMSQAHDNICAGHPGPEKMLHLLRRRYFWPGMRADIRIHAQTCDKCNRQKKGNRHRRSPMRRYHAGEPLERVHLDILGPLAETPRGNKYVLVMIDQFTKWIELHALAEQTADTVARVFVEEFICRLGCARHVFTDQGTNFESRLFHQVCELLQMAKSRTTAYRPSANGHVERMNREILAKLRIHIDGKQSQWDCYLPYVGMAMRATVSKSTGFTPNMMMLGREVALPLDLMTRPLHQDHPDSADYVSQLRDLLGDAHQIAREKIGAVLHDRKRLYDLKAYNEDYEVGDLVYLQNKATKKGHSQKLQPIFTGPLLIVQKIPDALFLVTGNRGRRQIVHHDRLRRCSDRNVPLWARRERRKLEDPPEDTVEVEIENLDLSDLFHEHPVLDPEEDPVVNAEEDPVPNADEELLDAIESPDLDSPDLPSAASNQEDVPDSQPARTRSGRPSRQPAWLRDYILHRGTKH